MTKRQNLGTQIIVELYNCCADILCNPVEVEKGMIQAAEKAKATVLQSNFHHFSPLGVSGVVVIMESHLTIHTWPENNYAAIDVFTCGSDAEPWEAVKHLKTFFESKNSSVMEIKRGLV